VALGEGRLEKGFGFFGRWPLIGVIKGFKVWNWLGLFKFFNLRLLVFGPIKTQEIPI